MLPILAGGGKEELAGSTLVLALEFVLVLGLDALLVAVPIVVARRREAAGVESISGFAILWGILAAWCAGSAVLAEFAWATERMRRLLGGYEDAATSADGPQHPWGWWIALAAFYALLVAVAVLDKRRSPDDPADLPKGP
jgi:hypothetical protein